MMISVSPAFTWRADFDEGPSAGCWAEIGGPHHRRSDQTGMLRRFDRGRDRRQAVSAAIAGGVAGGLPAAVGFRATRIDTPSCSILDLGKAGFIEQLRQFADHVVIDRGLGGLWAPASSAFAGSRACEPRSILGVDHGGETGDRERIAFGAKAAHHRTRDLGHVGAPAEMFARVDIADVHLDDRRLERGERVEDRDRGVAVTRGIDDQPRRFRFARLLNPVDDLAFMVGLAEVDREPVPFRRSCGKAFRRRRASRGRRFPARGCRAD